ncbi:MAG: NUDIX domain-containing protein [Bacillota bacterium]|nr:NUDIX domain-containing protein [Bacillota bacterium]
MEQLMILNEDGTPSGSIADRSIAHREGLLHGTSQIFIYRIRSGELEILLQRRSEHKDSFPGLLDISCAGHVPLGESYESNALKELSEELGIKAKSSDLTFVGYFRSSKINEFYGQVFNDRQISAVYIMHLDVPSEKIVFQEEEISEVFWMKDKDISKRLLVSDEEFCINAKRYFKVVSIIKEAIN